MEPVSLWAAVEFTACNGSTEALLTAAARAGLHPYGVIEPAIAVMDNEECLSR